MPKFRVWMKSLKWMCDVTNISLDSKFVDICQQGDTERYTEMSVEFDEITLMQSTGLEDKNGKEIFEGDILCDEGIEQESEFVYVTVSYREGMWVCDQITDELCGYGGALNEFNNDYSIIGNIYENPELLEEKK